LKRVTTPGNFCGSPKFSADSRRLVAYCMDAEDTLEIRRPNPRPENEKDTRATLDTRLVSIDLASGAMSTIQAGPGAKFNPSFIAGDVVGYVRKDQPDAGKEDFEHSLPLDDVLKKSILAVKLNGEPIPAVHGGPVRFITPGYFGTMQVKWLSRLRFEAAETSNYNHVPRYRMPNVPVKPGDKYDYTTANSVPSWRMNVKSVVLFPAPGEKLSAGRVTIRGVAFNDGEAKIDTVLVSLDEGRTWRPAELEVPGSPFAWTRWQFPAMLNAGPANIWARAIDTRGRSQPLDGSTFWNPPGYEWNGVEKIGVTVG